MLPAMSERDPTQADPGPEDPSEDQREELSEELRDDEQVETPFDHPLFLPVVLLGLSLWFLWDGFIAPMEEHLAFNRWGFAVLALATLYFGVQGLREMRRGRDSGSGSDAPGGDDATR